MKVLIIIPAYNEELNIVKTVKDVTSNTKYDYIIINDGSKDNTRKICEDNRFNVLSLPVNYGLTSAVQVGMKYALKENYDVAIQFDGDGQHQAKELDKLVKGIEEGSDIVIGSRFVTEVKPKTIRMLGSNLITGIIKLTTGKTIKDPTSGMRAYDKETIEELVYNSGLSPEPDTIVYMLKKKKIKEVQVDMTERVFGERYLKPFTAMKYMINMFCSIIFIRSFTKKK